MRSVSFLTLTSEAVISWTCQRVDREFTPGEAERITGVSTALQRDWRRRGIITSKEDGSWTRWTLDDLARLAVMKLFTQAGVDVSKIGTAAAMAIMPVLDAIGQFDDAFEIIGHGISDDDKARAVAGMRGIRTTDPNVEAGRYIATFGSGEYDIVRTSDLAKLAEFMEDNKQSAFAVVDCFMVAAQIVGRAGGPIIRFEIEAE